VIEAKPKRQQVKKSVRFAVFDRDSFTCQYCGRRPPEVTLVVDHAHPVVEGGDNDPVNLVTSCVDCNAGKGRRLLGASQAPDAAVEAARCAQQAAELEMYRAAKEELRKSLGSVVDALGELWCETFHTIHAPADDIVTWCSQYGPEEVEFAVNRSQWKRANLATDASRKRYVGGILRNRANTRNGQDCSTCEQSFVGTNGHLACLLKPAKEDDTYYRVHAHNSCREWIESDV
jgi:hypothetical protein